MFGPLEQFEITIDNLQDLRAYDILLSHVHLTLYEEIKCAFFLTMHDILNLFVLNDFYFNVFRALFVWIILTGLAVNFKNYVLPNKWNLFFESVYSFLAVMSLMTN